MDRVRREGLGEIREVRRCEEGRGERRRRSAMERKKVEAEKRSKETDGGEEEAQNSLG
jgi:hypothetical protein